ncbi:MAG: carbohydrate porin [Bacteroides sp.]|nr:carbohydrate porin [Bacteroides sp.]
MKRVLLIACMIIGFATTASAQFEKGKFIFNPSVTGLSFSYDLNDNVNLGIGSHVGVFIADNIAALGVVNAQWNKAADNYGIGVGMRYYFDQSGIYLGGTADVEGYKYKGYDFNADFGLGIEAGYAFFIARNVTIEPAVFYKWRFRDNNNSKVGARIGFGLFF